MRWRLSLTAVSCLILLSAAPAQTSNDIFVTPIPNAPFSGVVNVQRSIVQPNGSVLNLRTTRGIGRDSQGRIYSEVTTLVPVAATQAPPVYGVHIYDPQTRISIMLNTREHTFRSGTVDRPPATVPPALLQASPTGNSLPVNQFTKDEDLGTQQIDGVTAHGVRETQTIPADASGSGKEILVTDEYWYSDDLRINVVLKHSDPRSGSVTMTVTQVARTDPDPARFVIPEGYTRPKPRTQQPESQPATDTTQ